MKAVLIVAQEAPDSPDSQSYKTTARLLQMSLETRNDADQPSVQVKIVDNCSELEGHLKDGQHRVVDAVVFLSRAMMTKAEEIKSAHPKLRVVLMTAATADDQVIVIDKALLGASNATIAAVLG